MRAKSVGVAVVVLAAGLAGCGKKTTASDGQTVAGEPSSAPAAKAPATMPKRKGGLWEQTMSTAGRAMKTSLCTDEAFEKQTSLLATNSMPGACTQTMAPMTGGWKFTSSCDLGTGGKSTTEGTVTGDFASKYEVKASSTISGASVPQMNRQTDVDIVAEYKGACPAGWAPGDMELPGVGRVNATTMMKGAGRPPAPQ